jgi:hypothetical protein
VERNGTRNPIGYTKVDLRTLSLDENEIDQMKKDQLYDLYTDEEMTEVAGRSQIRIAAQWIYSKVKLLEDIKAQVTSQIAIDEQELT